MVGEETNQGFGLSELSCKKTLTTHRMPGVLILKKNTKFGIRKKTLAKGKGLKTLLNLSLLKEIESTTILTSSQLQLRYIGCECCVHFVI
jgi:hypothetical protein